MDTQLSHPEYLNKFRDEEFHNNISLLLDGIRSIENLGLICRSAESVNIKEILLCNSTIDLSDKKLKRISRSTTSKVTIRNISLEGCRTLSLKQPFIGIEITENSGLVYDLKAINEETVLVAGAERTGISNEILQLCSSVYHLPIFGSQSSINLACAVTSAVHWGSYVQRRMRG